MKSNFLPTGQIVNTHGLKGYVKVMPWADDPSDLLDFDRFFIDGREYEVESSAQQKTMVLLKQEISAYLKEKDWARPGILLLPKFAYVCMIDAAHLMRRIKPMEHSADTEQLYP